MVKKAQTVPSFGKEAINLALQWLNDNPSPYGVFLLTQEAGIDEQSPFKHTAGCLGFVADNAEHDETLLIFTRSDGQGSARFVKSAIREVAVEQGNLYINYSNLLVMSPGFLPNPIIAIVRH